MNLAISFTRENLKNFIISLPILWIFTGLFLFEEGHKATIPLVLISAIFSFRKSFLKYCYSNFINRKLAWLLLISASYAIASKLYHGYNINELRTLISLLVFAIIVPKHILDKAKENITALILISSICCFTYSIYQGLYLGLGRYWSINPIPYSAFSVSIASIALFLSISLNEKSQKLMMLLCLGLCMVNISIGQVRGAYLSFSFASLITISWAFFSGYKSSIKFNKTIVLFCIIFFASIALILKPSIEAIVTKTVNELDLISTGEMNSSIGVRLQLYISAIELNLPPKLIGYGQDNYGTILHNLYLNGHISEFASKLNSFHNQFIQTLTINGIIGLAILITWLFFPIFEMINRNNAVNVPLIIVPAVYFVSSLTDVPFQKPYSLSFFIIFLLIYINGNRHVK